MHSVQFVSETSSDGVRERDFTVGEVPGVLWSPVHGSGRAPLVLMGHGGGRDSKAPAMTGRAQRLVTGCGFHVAAIDAPGHGSRPRTAHDEQEIAAMQRAMAAGEPVGPIVVRYNAHLAERAVPEWRATLDALQQLPEIGPDGPVGYFGLNMGTAIGVPLTAVDRRISAAVFGQFWPESLLEAARRITVPIEFVLERGIGRAGPAGSLVVVGAPGIGKTTLWEAGVALARERGLRVLSARASGAETQLSLASLGDLLDGVGMDELAELPAPQLHAL